MLVQNENKILISRLI